MQSREIEKKFELKSPGTILLLENVLETAVWAIEDMITITGRKSGTDTDDYWKIDEKSVFRLRLNHDGKVELTLKVKDKETNTDRFEENLDVNSHGKASNILAKLYGNSLGQVNKTFAKVTFIGGEMAIYRVARDGRVFLEIEAQDINTVNMLAAKVMGQLSFLEIIEEPRSIYELYVKDNNAK